MTPHAQEEFLRLHDLIEAGKLPKTAMPRFFHAGHELLHGIYLSNRQYKCIKCEQEFSSTSDNPLNECPNCAATSKPRIEGGLFGDFFDVTEDGWNRWRCRECKHEWEAINGTICPECKAESHK